MPVQPASGIMLRSCVIIGLKLWGATPKQRVIEKQYPTNSQRYFIKKTRAIDK
jgi:hypothetical protein